MFQRRQSSDCHSPSYDMILQGGFLLGHNKSNLPSPHTLWCIHCFFCHCLSPDHNSHRH
jgi:hypothetical protein